MCQACAADDLPHKITYGEAAVPACDTFGLQLDCDRQFADGNAIHVKPMPSISVGDRIRHVGDLIQC